MKETPPQKRHVVRRWSLVTEHGRAMIALMAWLTHFARKVSHGTPLRSTRACPDVGLGRGDVGDMVEPGAMLLA
jgi:hypothetical protein